MKKTGLVLALLLATSLAAQAQTVGSANVMGYSKSTIEAGGAFYMMTCNFETAVTNTLLSVFGTNTLTQDDNLLNCDRVFLYAPATQTYQAWAQWTDGVFYKANDLTEWGLGTAGNPELLSGTGFFLSSGNVSNTILLSGDVVMVATQNVDIVTGYQILGVPLSGVVNLQDTGFFDSGAAADNNLLNCDRVHTYNAGTYQAYAIWTDGVWYKANDLTEWGLGIAATNDLNLNEGFFYEAQADMTWSETNSYINNL